MGTCTRWKSHLFEFFGLTKGQPGPKTLVSVVEANP